MTNKLTSKERERRRRWMAEVATKHGQCRGRRDLRRAETTSDPRQVTCRVCKRMLTQLARPSSPVVVYANDEDAPFQQVKINFDGARNVPCPDCGSRVYARWWPQLRTWELTECVGCGAVFYSWWDGTTERS